MVESLLMEENKDILVKILMVYVVVGEVKVEDLVKVIGMEVDGSFEFEIVLGDMFSVLFDGEMVIIIDENGGIVIVIIVNVM